MSSRVGDQFRRRSRASEELRRAAVVAPPTNRVHLVDVDRLPRRVRRGAFLHPLGVVPVVPSSDVTTEQFAGRSCIAKPYGSALRMARPFTRADLVLVRRAGATSGMNSSRCRSRRAPASRGGAVPEVERATMLTRSHSGPTRRSRAGEPIEHRRVRAELVVDAVVVAFAEQVQVEVRQLRREEVGVVLGQLVPSPIADVQR